VAQNFCLKFISGKYQGGEFPLLPEREIVIGRSSDLDMVLVEDMVSRKHAKISTQNGQVVIQDLGSTNGTFVNGEKIKKTRLKEGDRILIGTSILKVVSTSAPAADVAQARKNMEAIGSTATEDGSKSDMTGRLEEVPVPDLLQLFSTSKRTGTLHIRSAPHFGKIYLRDGNVFYAAIDDNHDLGPMKAFCRIVGWKQGQFEFGRPEDTSGFLVELEDSTQSLLEKANEQVAAYDQLSSELPQPHHRLAIPRPLEPQLSLLGQPELDVLQLVHNHGTMQKVLDHSSTTDFETATALVNLMVQGYVAAQK
jgi:hypothetical protein